MRAQGELFGKLSVTNVVKLCHAKIGVQRFPIDALKIDRSFVQGVESSNNAKAIFDSIIALVRELNKAVIAEGVEEQTQVRFLTESRCDLLQGYYFSQPLSAANFAEFASRDIHNICDRRQRRFRD